MLASTLKLLQKILKSAGVRKLPMMINSTDDVVDASKNFLSQRLCTSALTCLSLVALHVRHALADQMLGACVFPLARPRSSCA